MLRPCASERLAAGTSAVMTAAPLRIDRRETSVGGTRAVVSSQQLMNGSPAANLSLRQQSSTQPKSLKRPRTNQECASKHLLSGGQTFLVWVPGQKICPMHFCKVNAAAGVFPTWARDLR